MNNNETCLSYSTKSNYIYENQIIDSISERIYSELIDDVIFGLMLQVHRAAKLDYLIYLEPDLNEQDTDKQFEIYDDNDVLGVFSSLNENSKISTSSSGRNGQNSGLVKYECVCPNCDRSLAAIRFAPHLEKCMGMGRNSSRIATRRIANYNGDELDQLIESAGLIPNYSTKSNQLSNSQEDDLMSIINAVATANESSSSSSLIDIELSSNSSSCSNNYTSLKPPNAKKKRIQQNSKSVGSNLTNLGSNQTSLQTSNTIHNNLNIVTNQNVKF